MAGLPPQKRKEVRVELRGHLNDSVRQRIAQGSERALAEQEAVAAFGNVAVLNHGLLRAHFGRKWPLYILLHRFGWWLPEVPRVRLRPKFAIWKFASKYRRQYAEGRFDEIIERLERELASAQPNDDLHGELGLAYNAIGEHERALTHLQAAVDWHKEHPSPQRSAAGKDVGLAGAYCNLAGVLETLGREVEAEAAVKAGLAADDRSFLLNFQQARYCLRRGDSDGVFAHLEASLKPNDSDMTKGGHGRTLLLILCSSDYDSLRAEPRFGALAYRAYRSQSDAQKTLGSEYEDLAAMPGGLAVDGQDFLRNCQQARGRLEGGDLAGAFHHLEASLDNTVKNGNPGAILLLTLSAADFDPLRKEPQFDRLLRRAYDCR